MSKKNLFLLRSCLVVLLVVIFISSVYYYFHKNIIDFYSQEESEDIFLSTMSSEKITSFDNGRVLVTGEFLQNDNVYENKSLFVKSYTSTGEINTIGSVEIPVGYSLSDTMELEDSLFLLYTSESKKSGKASVYEISSDGILLSSHNINIDTFPNRSKELFLIYEDGDVNYAAIIGNVFYVYNFDGILLRDFYITPDIKIYDVVQKNETYILAGRIKNDNGYSAYYTAYKYTGELEYSISTMTDTPSFAGKIIDRINANDNFYFITGYFFDSDEYSKHKEGLSPEELFEIGEKSLRMTEPGVLLTSSFASDPWPSLYVMKIGMDGTIISSVSPDDVNNNTGVSSVSYVNTACDDSESSFPVLCITSSVATNKKSDSYTLSVYSLNSDLSFEYSSDILMNADVRNTHIINGDGSLTVFSELNKKYSMKMHRYNSIIDYAKDLRNLTFYYRIIYFIESCSVQLPMIVVFMVFIISVKYRIWDYLGKKKILDKWTV